MVKGHCTVCNKTIEDDECERKVHTAGLQSFIAKSKDIKDEKYQEWEKIPPGHYILLHDSCRKKYLGQSSKPVQDRRKRPKLNESEHQVADENDENVGPEAPAHSFDYDTLCIVCGQALNPKRHQVGILQARCEQANLTEWATSQQVGDGAEVLQRLKQATDDNIPAKYHYACRKKPYRPKPSENIPAIDDVVAKVSDYIENSGDFKFDLTTLRKIMDEHNNTVSVTEYVLSKKLQEKFGDDLIIIRQSGKQPLYLYKTKNLFATSEDWLGNPNDLPDFEKNIVLKLAAEIIKNEVTQETYDMKEYPPGKHFLATVVSDIPKSLINFLNYLLPKDKNKNNVKRDSVAHTIMCAVRPRTFISKLQLAVGTYVLRKTGSKHIITLLNKLGVSASYHNIQMYEASTIMNPPPVDKSQAFVQFTFDNTDHNVSTLTGHETFHCLGGIAVYTPHYEVKYNGGSTKCLKMPSAEEIAAKESIPIIPFTYDNEDNLKNIVYTDTNTLQIVRNQKVIPTTYVSYLLAKANKIDGTSSWKGFMEHVYRENSYQLSHIECLPFVNGPPHDMRVLYSALCYAVTKADECNQHTVFVTFDLPLWIKSRKIVALMSHDERFLRIVIRMGGFHLILSFLKANGHIMADSGLEDLWSTVYAAESLKQMLTGHAFARAVRAHILTFTALGIIICKKMSGTNEWVKNYLIRFCKWTSDSHTAGDYNADMFLSAATDKFIEQLETLEKCGPTAKLWIQYMKMVIIMLRFIESERLGLWNENLQSMEEMQPYLLAAGHWAYVKALQIFLQDMCDLKQKMTPEEYNLYTSQGFFTIRRTDKAFSGIWSDLTIEQTLNRFFGTDLRHGRGVTASVVARYFLGMPSAFQVMESLENYVDIVSANSEQHVDTTKSRVSKDDEHLEKFVFWLEQRDPFESRDELTSLSTGIIGDSKVDCHMAYEKGREGMKIMIGKNMTNVTLSAKYKVGTFSSARRGIHIHEDCQVINTNLLFQRIAVYFHGDEEKTKDALKYELSPYPPSLFDDNGYMRKPNKADLYKDFTARSHTGLIIKDFYDVIDGGWLLHRIPWPHSKTYAQVCEIYFMYIAKHFGMDTTVVFDGYSEETVNSTKSYERHRRKEKNVAPDVDIQAGALVTMTQKKFMSNVANKYKFVALLAAYLNERGIKSTIATDDADLQIVKTAIEINAKELKAVAVIGNDVDLLILLIGLAPEQTNIFLYKFPPARKNIQLFAVADNSNHRQYILFAHAFAGCDGTSALYEQGKRRIFKILQENVELQQSVAIFSEPNKTIEELYAVAETMIKKMYRKPSKVPRKYKTTSLLTDISIDELRYETYKGSVLTGTKECVLAFVPPTESALRLHTKRVYYQIQTWLDNEKINPLDWGWSANNIMLVPMMLENGVKAVPESLLEKIFCSCTGDCSSSRCSCRKCGLKCSDFCKNCNGDSCSNHKILRLQNDELDEDDQDENAAQEGVNNEEQEGVNNEEQMDIDE